MLPVGFHIESRRPLNTILITKIMTFLCMFLIQTSTIFYVPLHTEPPHKTWKIGVNFVVVVFLIRGYTFKENWPPLSRQPITVTISSFSDGASCLSSLLMLGLIEVSFHRHSVWYHITVSSSVQVPCSAQKAPLLCSHLSPLTFRTFLLPLV